jgi:flagellar hook-basal body complex protein FliE
VNSAGPILPLNPLPSIDPRDAVSGTVTTGAPPAASGTTFSNLVTKGLEQVNDSLLTNQLDIQRLAAGDADNLHRMMIRLEESRLSFQLMMQIRNRLLESYQELMRMQV